MASSSLRPYLYELLPNSTTYHFVTVQQVAYEAYFTEGEGYFPDMSFAPHAEMFSIFPQADSNSPQGFDARIGLTIASIIEEKFADNPFAVICYVCDQREDRAYQRARRFARVFEQSSAKDAIVKIDIKRPPVFATVLFHRDNPAYLEIERGVQLLLDKFE